MLSDTIINTLIVGQLFSKINQSCSCKPIYQAPGVETYIRWKCVTNHLKSHDGETQKLAAVHERERLQRKTRVFDGSASLYPWSSKCHAEGLTKHTQYAHTHIDTWRQEAQRICSEVILSQPELSHRKTMCECHSTPPPPPPHPHPPSLLWSSPDMLLIIPLLDFCAVAVTSGGSSWSHHLLRWLLSALLQDWLPLDVSLSRLLAITSGDRKMAGGTFACAWITCVS